MGCASPAPGDCGGIPALTIDLPPGPAHVVGMANPDDPVLNLLPDDRPDLFDRFPPAEQAWRGRLWITMFGAGYEPLHAWWLVFNGDEAWEAEMKSIIDAIPDDQYPRMIEARLAFDGRSPGEPSVGRPYREELDPSDKRQTV